MMTTITPAPARSSHLHPPRAGRGPTPILFAALFAAQAGLLSLGPILPDVAREFGVTAAAAGQLRTLSGLGGGAAAIMVAILGSRLGLRRTLIAGHSMLALGAVGSATAPSLLVLAAAQASVGAGAGLVIAGALAASAAWTEPGRRARTLAVTSLGQPISWVVGMPVGGLLAQLDWRYSLVAVPLAAALSGIVLVARFVPPARSTAPSRALRTVPAWALPELLSYAAWSGVLVFAGSLLVESYSISPGVTGVLLGVVALAALPGNVLARPWLSGHARQLLVVLGLAATLLTLLFGSVRPNPAVSTGLLALLVLVASTRTVAGSAFALQLAGDRRLAAMGVRAATGQFGYLLGAAVGGVALAAGGYELLAVALAALFALGTVPHVAWIVVSAPRPGTATVAA